MRKILHVDADCFFAAVEVLDNPRLAGRPIAVGGDPSRRGVIATCSYEARKSGVRSAMASAYALRLCPDLHIIKPNFHRYKQVSQAMHHIFAHYSDTVEPLSLDEAYLDVTQSDCLHGSATWIAQALQAQIHKELGITVSAGVAPIKFLAKVASDWRKPNGFYAVCPDAVEDFVAQLPVGRLPGVGPATVQRLNRFGLYWCRDIRKLGLEAMQLHFGAFGRQLYDRACGRDESRVEALRPRKSLSVERTYAQDRSPEQLSAVVPELLRDLQTRFEPLVEQYKPYKYFVKLKFSDFTQTTLETTLPSLTTVPSADDFLCLLHAAWMRCRKPVRLAGLGLRFYSPPDGGLQQRQLNLF